jgi:hypothetical protein
MSQCTCARYGARRQVVTQMHLINAVFNRVTRSIRTRTVALLKCTQYYGSYRASVQNALYAYLCATQLAASSRLMQHHSFAVLFILTRAHRMQATWCTRTHHATLKVHSNPAYRTQECTIHFRKRYSKLKAFRATTMNVNDTAIQDTWQTFQARAAARLFAAQGITRDRQVSECTLSRETFRNSSRHDTDQRPVAFLIV